MDCTTDGTIRLFGATTTAAGVEQEEKDEEGVVDPADIVTFSAASGWESVSDWRSKAFTSILTSGRGLFNIAGAADTTGVASAASVTFSVVAVAAAAVEVAVALAGFATALLPQFAAVDADVAAQYEDECSPDGAACADNATGSEVFVAPAGPPFPRLLIATAVAAAPPTAAGEIDLRAAACCRCRDS